MKTSDVLFAMQTLETAADALIGGSASIAMQISIGGDCRSASIRLRYAIEAACPDVKIEKESA